MKQHALLYAFLFILVTGAGVYTQYDKLVSSIYGAPPERRQYTGQPVDDNFRAVLRARATERRNANRIAEDATVGLPFEALSPMNQQLEKCQTRHLHFVHLRKAGGTVVADCIRGALGLPDAQVTGYGERTYRQRPGVHVNGTRVYRATIQGREWHLSIHHDSLYERIARNPNQPRECEVYITLLRSPLERLMSFRCVCACVRVCECLLRPATCAVHGPIAHPPRARSSCTGA